MQTSARNNHSTLAIEERLSLLGKRRQRLGTEILQYEAATRAFVERIAEDIVHEKTGLCAHCDAEAYQHAVKDLVEHLTGHVAADVSEGVQLWLEQREVGAL